MSETVCSSFDKNEDYDLIGHLLDCRWIWLGKDGEDLSKEELDWTSPAF